MNPTALALRSGMNATVFTLVKRSAEALRGGVKPSIVRWQ